MKRFSESIASNRSISQSVTLLQRSFINDELDEQRKKLEENINWHGSENDAASEMLMKKSHRDLLKWLLVKVMLQFEISVREIAFLMNDSFSRFQTNQAELYQKLYKLSLFSNIDD